VRDDGSQTGAGDVRRLPGRVHSLDDADNPPPGWVPFDMFRNAEDSDEVICFGFFAGTVDQLRANAAENNYAEQLAVVAPSVESVETDELYEIVEECTA